MNSVIASRVFKLKSSGEVNVEVYAPFKDGSDYLCEYVINGLSFTKTRHAYGIDSVQALWLALKRIGTDLYTSDAWAAGDLLWSLSENTRDLGLPVPDTLKDMVPDVPNTTPWGGSTP